MNKIATVNGVAVYSDKRMTSIVGPVITFMDGSSCNVETGMVNNRGSGSIQIGEGGRSGKKGGEKAVTKGPTSFATTGLDVSGVAASITVEVWDKPGMEVVLTGQKDVVDAITTKMKGNVLHINNDSNGRSGGNAKFSGSGISISGRGSIVAVNGGLVCGSIRGANVIVTGNDMTVIDGNDKDAASTHISVKVPKGANIKINDVTGEIKIGDVDGDLDVNVAGSGNVHSGRMRSATIKVMGHDSVTVSEVNGPLTGQIMGSGDINVRAGTVTTLSAQIMGSGDFRFDGVADTAMLCVMGSGDIKVHKVKSPPMQQRMGTGKIRVG